MINSRRLSWEFDYTAPTTVSEALDLLDQFGGKAKIFAGGTDLLIQLKEEKLAPQCLINITRIRDLNHIHADGGLRVGAATKLSQVREHCIKGGVYTALHEAISVLGKPQVWNMGTIGGNLCNASPSADTAPPLLVFNARVKLLSRASERTLDLQEFFKGVNCTALGPDEMMVEILLDPPRPNTGSAFMKISRVGADISKVSCAVALERKADLCLSCRVALGAVAPVPMRANGAEGILEGEKVEARLVEAAGQRVAEEIKPIDDIRSTAEYRRWVAAVTFRDVFWKAWRRAAGEEK